VVGEGASSTEEDSHGLDRNSNPHNGMFISGQETLKQNSVMSNDQLSPISLMSRVNWCCKQYEITIKFLQHDRAATSEIAAARWQ